MKLGIIIGSTRPVRTGDKLAEWLAAIARETDDVVVDMIDLCEIDLPFFNEAKHPRSGDYQHQKTVAWSQRIAACDAFVVVTPEYNHSAPAGLLNAVTFLIKEWRCKPVAFLSYGGISGGLRAVQQMKLTFLAVEAVPIPEAVVVPFVGGQIKDGAFVPNQVQQDAAPVVIKKLKAWADAVLPLRNL